MMRIGILSDTHDHLANLTAALAFFQSHQVDLVVHCGDWKSPATAEACRDQAAALGLPVQGVLGNNDHEVARFLGLSKPGFKLVEGVLELSLAGMRLAAYHGHHAPTKRRVLADPQYDAVLLGHTHKPLVEKCGQRLIINPGSTAFAIPRSKTWRPSVALLDVSSWQANIHYI